MIESLDRQQFAHWLTVEEGTVESYEDLRSAPTEYVLYLGSKYAWLSENDYDREAFEVIVLILRIVEYIPDLADRAKQSYWACRGMAVTCSFLGLWQDSIEGYERAIHIGEDGAYPLIEASYRGPGGAGSGAQYQPADHRELGSMHGRVGSYGEALDHHRIAEERLEAARSRLDVHTYRDELARLRNARALVRMDLGEYKEAERDSLAAASIEEELGEENPLRFLQAAIDYMSAGKARRGLALRKDEGFTASFATFDDALRVLTLAPSGRREHSDRESEVYLERGRTHLMDGDHEAAITDLERALSLTSDFNLIQHAGAHHLYLGEAYLDADDPERAEVSLEKAAIIAEDLGTPETLWQGQRMLAAVFRAGNAPEKARTELRKCIDIIEQLRSQTLPESSKISMLEPKDRAYEDLVIDLCESGSEDAETTEVARALEITEAFN
jgi:tetratricopeptide (TPR) repeat protein